MFLHSRGLYEVIHIGTEKRDINKSRACDRKRTDETVSVLFLTLMSQLLKDDTWVISKATEICLRICKYSRMDW